MINKPKRIFMKRRELIKGLGVLTLSSFIPVISMTNLPTRKKFHFVGLGAAGTNIARHIQQKGIVGEYSCMTWFPSIVEPIPFDPNPFEPYPFVKYKGINHIDYEYPLELRKSNELGRKRMPLTKEMKSILSQDCIYVVFVGLGAFTGTSLISDVVEFLEFRNTNYLAICSLPFRNEGKWRNEYADMKKEELSVFRNVRFFDNELIKTKYGPLQISKSFEIANEETFKIFKAEFHKLVS